MKLIYFAWVREKTGISEEDINLPSEVSTVSQLVEWLINRGDNYQSAFADLKVIKVAVNQDYVSFDTSIKDGDEVAFFPPVTGG
ncbi:MAG: molybdopterin converting factor subunit 1 [Rhodospirillales bacterium]|jgi:sulfur-carrier protein|nr:molybdopterin converting factor subunit 1 [Rhodospirillales bacterium]